ncbi:MAG: hypothetical protein KGO49_13770 [Gammaproteobacteria bacterium]|nr:hypothetical protein [Gammaproteobacteria bacterium]
MPLQNKPSHSSLILRRSRLTNAVLLSIYSACFAAPVYAMQAIDDQTMSDTTGADGLVVNVQATNVAATHAYWSDPNSSGVGALDLQNISITNNAGSGTPFSLNATLNTGSSNLSGVITPALQLNLNINTPTLFTAQSLVLCSGVTSGTPSSCSGATAPGGAMQLLNGTTNGVTSTSPLTASLTTTNGFLNSNGSATVKLLLSNGNIFFTSNGTQLVTSDIYANITATGRIWVDATDGFRFSTSGPNVTGGGITLTSPYSSDAPGSWNGTEPINAGLQYSLVMQTPGTQSGVTANQLNKTANGMGITTSGSGLTFGVSGGLPQLDLSVRGASATTMTTDGVGGTVGGTADSSLLGTAGGGNAIVANMTGTIKNGGASGAGVAPPAPTAGSFKLYFGASGQYGYGVQMSEFVPFGNVTAAVDSSFTSGNIYMNLLTSSTTQLILPISKVFAGNTANTASYFNATLNGDTSGSGSGALSDTTQVKDLQDISVPATGGSLFFAIRGLNIQGVPMITSFYQNGVGVCTGVTTCSTGAAPQSNFSILPVINNLNTNITLNAASTIPTTGLFASGGALAGTVAALNYSFAISIAGNNGGTEGTGSGAAGTAGTLRESALLMVDTVNKQYIGLRDINLYLKADGLLVLQGTATSNSFNLTLPHFMLAAQMGVAAGYLPGAEPAGAPSFVSGKDTAMTINLGLTSDATNNQYNLLSFTDNQGTSATAPNSMTFGLNLTLAGTSQSKSVITACTTGTVYSCSSGATTVAAVLPDQSLAGGNFFRIIDNSGSALGLDNITGTINASAQLTPGSTTYQGYNPYNLTSTTPTQVNSLTVTSNLQINPANAVGGELLTTLDFYPSTSGGTAQSLGKMVLTGGQIISNLTLTPITHN